MRSARRDDDGDVPSRLATTPRRSGGTLLVDGDFAMLEYAPRQRASGAADRVIERPDDPHHARSYGHGAPPLRIGTALQAKIAVGEAGNSFEREATAVADRTRADEAGQPNSQGPDRRFGVAQRQLSGAPSMTDEADEETESGEPEQRVAQTLIQRQATVDAAVPDDDASAAAEPDTGQPQVAQAFVQRCGSNSCNCTPEEHAANENGAGPAVQTSSLHAIQRQGVDVRPADDPLEADADQVAKNLTGAAPSDAVAAGPTAGSDGGDSRAADSGEQEGGETAHHSAGRPSEEVQASRDGTAPGHVGGVGVMGASTRSGGQPLPSAARGTFENRLGADLGHVRTHSDDRSSALNRTLHARAFTSGADIFFRTGEARADTRSGMSLLAHEVAHVVQQGGGGTPRSVAARQSQMANGPTSRSGAGVAYRFPVVQRQPQSEHITFTVFVPKGYETLEQVFRLFERTAYGRETNSKWRCNAYCDVTKYRGTRIEFDASRAQVEALTDPADIERQKKAKKDLGAKGAKEQKAIREEVDKRLATATGGEASKSGKKSEGEQRQWDQKLDEVTEDAKKLDALPKPVRDLLVGKNPTIQPKDYARFLKIADKLANLSPEDLQAFKLLTVRATDNLDLFEKSVDMFIARKAELVKAVQAQQQAQAQQPKKDDLQAAWDEKWKGLDEKAVSTMSESDRYALARKKADELTAAQIKYMKDHPGETFKDFAKSATLLNTPETFEGIGKDLSEAANGDANSWARWAAGTGAGAKLSGWILAVAGVLYVASWLTGIGELATIAAVAGYALAATLTLSAVESELRLKAASQATDPEEFKRQVQLAAAAQTNFVVGVALIVIAAALHFVAKAAFPKTVAKIRVSLKNFREQIRLTGSVYELKPTITTEMNAHRAEVVKVCESAKQQAAAMAKEVEGLSRDQFVDRLESGNGDFLDQTKAPKDQRLNYRDLAKTPEGQAALDQYKAAIKDALAKDVPAEIDKLQQDYVGKIDEFLKDVDAAKNHDDIGAAADKFEPALSDEHLKSLMRGEQDRLTQQKLADASTALEAKARQLQQQQAAQAPASPTTPPTTPTTPTEPVKPTTPTTPTEPVKPTTPTTPTEPVKPTTPTTPTEPVKPTTPTTPTEPVKPTTPTTPTEPVKPTTPTTPTEPVKPTTPTTPTEPVKPTTPTTPTEPVKPTTPTTPTEPVKPTTPTTPTEPVKPTTPTTPTEPVKPPGEPVDPSKAPPTPATPIDPVKQSLSDKISENNARLGELKPLRQKIRDLRAAIQSAYDKVQAGERELAKNTDPDRRAGLEKDVLDARRAHKAARDALQQYKEQHDLAGDFEYDFEASALEKENAQLDEALNPKASPGVDQTKPLGGNYDAVPAQGGEVNHMPADSVSPLSKGKGPGIRMDIADHYATRSWGSSKAAKQWRATQAALIKQGKFLDALKMDIEDVRSRNPVKYEKAIQQMLDYVAKSPEVSKLSKNSTVTVAELRNAGKPAPVPAP